MIVIQCQGCGKELRLADSAAGKRGKCPGCGGVVLVPNQPTNAPVTEVQAKEPTTTAPPLPRATPVPVVPPFAAPVSTISYFSPGATSDLVGTPAPFLPRAGAYLLDQMFGCAIALSLFAFFIEYPVALVRFFAQPTLGGQAIIELLFAMPFIVYCTYQIGTRGQTIGKAICGLRVVPVELADQTNTGQLGLGIGRAFRRTCGYILSSLFFYMGFWRILFRKDRRTWHDQLSGTSVLRAPRVNGTVALMIVQLALVPIGYVLILHAAGVQYQTQTGNGIRATSASTVQSQLRYLGQYSQSSYLIDFIMLVWRFTAVRLGLALALVWPLICLARAVRNHEPSAAETGRRTANSILGLALLLFLYGEALHPTMWWLGDSLFGTAGPVQRGTPDLSNMYLTLAGAMFICAVVIPPMLSQWNLRDRVTYGIVSFVFTLVIYADAWMCESNLLAGKGSPFGIYHPVVTPLLPDVLRILVVLAPVALAIPVCVGAWRVYRQSRAEVIWIFAGVLIFVALTNIAVGFVR